MGSELACKKCSKKFTNKRKLDIHVLKQICCPPREVFQQIKEQITKIEEKQNKKIRRTDMNEFQCHICDKSFANHRNRARMLKHHLIQHDVETTGKSPYQCKMCKKGFSWPHNKNAHEKNCNKKSNSPKMHTQSNTKKPTGANNPCENGNQTLAIQTNSHIKQLTCAESKRNTPTIKTAEKLRPTEFQQQRQGVDLDKSHVNRPPTKALPYKCKKCEKTFSDINTEFEEFARHQEWHRSEISEVNRSETDQSKSKPEEKSMPNKSHGSKSETALKLALSKANHSENLVSDLEIRDIQLALLDAEAPTAATIEPLQAVVTSVVSCKTCKEWNNEIEHEDWHEAIQQDQSPVVGSEESNGKSLKAEVTEMRSMMQFMMQTMTLMQQQISDLKSKTCQCDCLDKSTAGPNYAQSFSCQSDLEESGYITPSRKSIPFEVPKVKTEPGPDMECLENEMNELFG